MLCPYLHTTHYCLYIAVSCNIPSCTFSFQCSLVSRRSEQEVVPRTESVHGHTLKCSELKLLVSEAQCDLKHPQYAYDEERGSYTAWNANLCSR